MRKITLILILLSLSVLFTLSCTTTETSTTKKNVPLVNTRWGLLSLNGKKVKKPESGKEFFVIFKLNDTRFEGFAGCNGVGGNYEANIDGTIKLSGIISTMMACDVMEVETQFTQALENATTYKILGDELFLYTKGKETVKLFAVYLR